MNTKRRVTTCRPVAHYLPRLHYFETASRQQCKMSSRSWRGKLRQKYPWTEGVDSACNRNEHQEHFLGVKAAGMKGWQPYHLHVPTVLKSGRLNLLEPSGPVQVCNGIVLSLLSCKSLRPEDDSMSVETRSCLTWAHAYLIICKMLTRISPTGVWAASMFRFLITHTHTHN